MADNRIQDTRFQKVHNDPRFARVVNKKNKVKIDERFQGVLNDKEFQTLEGKVDKYGRKIENKQVENLKQYYELEKENSEEENAVETRIQYLNRLARGENDSDGDDSSDDSDEEELAVEEEQAVDAIVMDESTSDRIAVMNCDWTRIRAADLFVLLQSFVPTKGYIKNVAIYPSEYGVEQMDKEQQFGPQGLWNEKENTEDKQIDENVEAEEIESEPESEIDQDDPLGVKTSGQVDAFDPAKLRKYELQKLKYYFAVVSFDASATAIAVYDACDQAEYETSSNNLDLRFIPDDVVFTRDCKESCNAVPENFKPSLFVTNALQNTEIELTWENDDETRTEALTKVGQWKDMDDKEFETYLASDASSDEDDEEKKEAMRNKYKGILLGSDEESIPDMEEENDQVDQEFTFTPGLADEVLDRKLIREKEESETPHEAYLRKKKEAKNKKAHDKRKTRKEQERREREILNKPKHKLVAEVANKDDPELAKLVDEEGLERDFNMKEIERADRLATKKLGKSRKKKEQQRQEKIGGLQDSFEIDTKDERFAALYKGDAAFGIDPYDAKFKKTKGMEKILAERQATSATTEESTKPVAIQDAKKSQMAAMVDSIKRKAPKSKPQKPKKFKFTKS